MLWFSFEMLNRFKWLTMCECWWNLFFCWCRRCRFLNLNNWSLICGRSSSSNYRYGFSLDIIVMKAEIAIIHIPVFVILVVTAFAWRRSFLLNLMLLRFCHRRRFIIPITNIILVSFFSWWYHHLFDFWNTINCLLDMIRNGWNIVYNWIMFHLNIRLIMLFSWGSRSNSCRLAFFIIATMEFFFNHFIMKFWLKLNFSLRLLRFHFYRLYLFIFFIRIYVCLISYKSLSFKEILFSRFLCLI